MRRVEQLVGLLFAAGAGLLASSSACTTTLPPKEAKSTVVSFSDLDCSDCGETLARVLIQEDGVYKTAFDKKRVELTVVADPKIDAFALAEQKKEPDMHLVRGPGRGRYLPWQRAPEHVDMKDIAQDGADVPDLAPYLVSGKVTVIDFSATWCEACRRLNEHVIHMLSTRGDVAYRKVDVGDWDTPIASHYLEGVKELPYVMFFDKRGHRVDTMTGFDVDRFDPMVDRAAGQR